MGIREYRPSGSLNSVQLEFSGFEVELGVLRGARGWHIDKYGRLVGMSKRVVWAPGENVARCYADRLLQGRICKEAGSHRYVCDCRREMYEDQSVHSMANCESGHGFYAYHDGVVDYDYNGEPDAIGVIEGWGETVLGTRGFRCTKARITALSALPSYHAKLRELYGPDVALYGDRPRNRSRMFRDHPIDKQLDPTNLITPENDSDFWTREVKFK